MEQEAKINNLYVKYFQELEGFGGKKYVIYSDPNNSSILADDEEYEIYRNEYQNREELRPQESELGFSVAMKKNKPVNLTKEQAKIQQRIERGDDKTSKITASGSQFISEIFEGNLDYRVCQMCQTKEFIIADKNDQIMKLQSLLQERDCNIKHLTLKIQTLEERYHKETQLTARYCQSIKRLTAELDASKSTIAVLQEQRRQNRQKIDNFSMITKNFTENLQAKNGEISQLNKKLGVKFSKQESIIISPVDNNLTQPEPQVILSEVKSLQSSKRRQLSVILVDTFASPILLDLTTERVSVIRANQRVQSEIQPFEDAIRSLENLSLQSQSIRPYIIPNSFNFQ